MDYDVIILDNGIKSAFKYEKSEITLLENVGKEWVIVDEVNDSEHGTSVLGIILNQYEGRFLAFNVFKTIKNSYLEQVMLALKYILDKKIKCKFIVMSIGVMGYSDELEKLCSSIIARGIIIISAFNNNGAISYPAAFPDVIGVMGDPYIQSESTFCVNKGNIVDVLAKQNLLTKKIFCKIW